MIRTTPSPLDTWNNVGRTCTWMRSGEWPSDGWTITDTEPTDGEPRYEITHLACPTGATARLSDLTNLY